MRKGVTNRTLILCPTSRLDLGSRKHIPFICGILGLLNISMSATNTPQDPGSQNPRQNPISPGSWTTIDPPKGSSPAYWSGYPSSYSRTTYQATEEQLARDEKRLHYFRRNVYLPVIVALVLVLILFLLVVFLAFGVSTPEARSFIAGLSGLVVILMSIPVIALMSILPIIWLLYVLNRRQQRQLYPETGPMAYRSRLQILLWRLDSLIGQASRQAEYGAEALKRPLVKAHASADYIKGFGRGIRQNFTRSEPNEFEQNPAEPGTSRHDER
jgi:hypothetical protein